jgi:signal transduction histidine kinase
MNNLFQSATLRLTGWYLLILMAISLLFSGILYEISSAELRRSLRAPDIIINDGLFYQSNAAEQLRESRYNEGIARITGNLILLNIGALIVGGGLSYILARRTLRPIHEAMEVQGRFVSDASHELRTPLTVMQSEIEVGLRDSSATKADYKKLLESNLDEVGRLHELSDRLLQLSSQRDLELVDTQLDEVAIEALNRVVKVAQARNISVVNDVGRAEIRASRDALADAVTILLDNALKYGANGSTVTMHSSLLPRAVLLHVSDEGPGIAVKDLPYIFDRFYRVDSSRSRSHVEGHGLGLSIAKRIVQQHGGELSVESKLGKGSTFTIRLPRP